MSLYTNSILKRLHKGEDAQAIADEFANDLNSAVALYEEEQKADEHLKAATDSLNKYFAARYPKGNTKVQVKTLTDEDVRKVFDRLTSTNLNASLDSLLDELVNSVFNTSSVKK